MDIQPVNNGHVLVVPRAHYESLLDVPAELGLHLFRVTMSLAGAIRRVTGCDDLNIVVNSGPAAGQDEPHYHVHIIPRREGDGFDIPLPFGGSEMPDRTVLDAYAAQIIAALRDPVKDEIGATHGAEHSPAPGGARGVSRGVQPVAQAGDAGDDAKDGRAVERPVAVPLFDESGTADSSPRQPRRGEPHEGAHGELVYEPYPGDAAPARDGNDRK